MSIEVKICGLKTLEALEAALEAGADYVGLVFYAKSPRYVDIETAAEIAGQARGRARSVALLVNPSIEEAAEIAGHVNPDLIQLHGEESPETVRAVAQRVSRPIIKAVSVATGDDANSADHYDGAAQAILFDAMPMKADDGALPGGNGVPFDWRLLSGMSARRSFFLSGGLTPENVGDAIRLTGASAVDVSSGVESHPGVKDPDRIRRFVEQVRKAQSSK